MFWTSDKPSDLRGNWLFPTETRFGVGRLKELPDVLTRLAVRRPLIVTDRGLAKTPIPEAVRRCSAEASDVAVWAETPENPTGDAVLAGVAAFRDHKADAVIALGGGSSLDCGKAVALLAGCGGDLWRFAYPASLQHAHERTAVPVIAIPTTAGTGAEVEASSIITNPAKPLKEGIVNVSMLPRVVIADPELTVSLPPNLTAWTGMDALSHNLEALLVRQFHPMADAIGAAGVQICFDWLPRAVARGDDLVARAYMMAAATMGATAFVKGLGAMHALSHAIGALRGCQHGLTNAVLMPHVLTFNRPAIEPQIIALARQLGIEPRFDAFQAAVVELSRAVGIPLCLEDLGVAPADFERLAAMALPDFNAGTNPRTLDQPSLVGILQAASR